MSGNEKLKGKQDAFVKAYILNPNATQAAIAAGYSEKTARFIGSENLTKPNIIAAIKIHQKKTDSSFTYSKDKKLRILEEVMLACKAEEREKGVINAAAVIAAVKEHNAMMGHNAERLTNASKR